MTTCGGRPIAPSMIELVVIRKNFTSKMLRVISKSFIAIATYLAM